MNQPHFSALFQHIISHSFDSLQLQELEAIALGIWYENFTPHLEQFNPLQLGRAGYLLDRLCRCPSGNRLMRYNCLSHQRKLELLNLVNSLKAQILSFDGRIINCQTNNGSNYDVEPLALAWGLDEDISQLTPHLLQYQTRHYQLNRTAR
ncbi:hypothetical protein [Myxosarcina sp. GI1]|uniref:hypothetical protein n=1 Tax=Myxosarcina sp. GI1 TaxID=1541065 RepID=UPI00068F1ED2|nr:hypothetical protein [Myxosarcina sp. GI1]